MANININIWWRTNCQNVDINTAKYFQGKANRKSYQLKSETVNSSKLQCVCMRLSVFVCVLCALFTRLFVCVSVPLCVVLVNSTATNRHTHTYALTYESMLGNCFMALGGHTKRIKVMGTVTTTKLRTKQMRVRTLILRFTSTIYGHDWERTQDDLDYCASWKLNYRIFKWPSSVSRRCFTRVFSLRRHGRTFNTSSTRLLMLNKKIHILYLKISSKLRCAFI